MSIGVIPSSQDGETNRELVGLYNEQDHLTNTLRILLQARPVYGNALSCRLPLPSYTMHYYIVFKRLCVTW